MIKRYALPFLVTFFVGLLFAGLFGYWRMQTQPQESAKRIERIDQLETEGLPDFSAQDIENRKVTLSAFKGKIVIVSFWASWCGPCLEEMPSMISLIEKQGGDVELVAISGDSTIEDIRAFLKGFPKATHPNIHIIWDEDRRLAKLYDVDRLPESFIGGKNLKLAKKIVGSIDWFTEDSMAFMKDLKNR